MNFQCIEETCDRARVYETYVFGLIVKEFARPFETVVTLPHHFPPNVCDIFSKEQGVANGFLLPPGKSGLFFIGFFTKCLSGRCQ